jgi:hypothetical protein
MTRTKGSTPGIGETVLWLDRVRLCELAKVTRASLEIAGGAFCAIGTVRLVTLL